MQFYRNVFSHNISNFPKHELQNNLVFWKFEMGSKLKIGNEFAKSVFDSRFLLVHDIPGRATKSSELFSQTKKQVIGITSEIQVESAKAQRGSYFFQKKCCKVCAAQIKIDHNSHGGRFINSSWQERHIRVEAVWHPTSKLCGQFSKEPSILK